MADSVVSWPSVRNNMSVDGAKVNNQPKLPILVCRGLACALAEGNVAIDSSALSGSRSRCMNTVTDSVSVGESADAPLSEFAATIVEQIESGNLQLPTLPEVALKVRDVVENPDGTVSQVAEVVSQDAGLTARLLQVANSALYRGKVEITSLPMAISRLGCPFVRDLITVQVMKQMFQAANEAIDARLHGLVQIPMKPCWPGCYTI